MHNYLTAVLIGAGHQGQVVYGSYAKEHPDDVRFVAVAEPNETRRTQFAGTHNISSKYQFHSWEDLVAQGKIADVALVCTLDHLHIAPAIAALKTGYDVLLEKPMATSLADCTELIQVAELTGRQLQICHVLRYTSFFSTLHDIVTSGQLGDIVTVEHRENLPYWHMAHSYVRGNWRNSQVQGPMILTKCCHDLDIMYWNLGPCTRISSFGSLMRFRAESASPQIPERCTDGCPIAIECPWYAPRLYLDTIPLMHLARRSSSTMQRLGATLFLNHPALVNALRRLLPPVDAAFNYRGWPVSVISEDTSKGARLRALQTGPYGRCVYHCDNDVVDHQVVSMEFASGASGALIMHGHSHEYARTMRYEGTRATLLGKFAYGVDSSIEVHDHLNGHAELIAPQTGGGVHGDGDEAIMASFVHSVRDSSPPLTTARESLESHLMAFAAEESRVGGRIVNLDELRPYRSIDSS